MGDISIIARRLSDDYVQYGFSGSGGYFSNVGLRILNWYRKRKLEEFPKHEDLIEYLFSLGTTEIIGKPGSEYGGFPYMESHHLCHKPFNVGKTEREIFSQIAFIDYGYFFDSDERWYYIVPGPFRIKIPIMLVYNNLGKDYYEFDFLKKLEKDILKFIFSEYKNEKFDALITLKYETYKKDKQDILDEIINQKYPTEYFWENYKSLFDFFDDWILIKADSKRKNVKKIIVKEKEEKHIETIFWK